jgi:hypothetical protein
MSHHAAAALDVLESRLKTLLPPEYQDSYERVEPKSMGSAGLRFDADGRVAWNEMWQTFCDLALAGGPPHKGTLLEPGTREAIDANPAQQDAVVDEICRGIALAAELDVRHSPVHGWVRVKCFGHGMAGWLLRAIVMENISARRDGLALDLPAAPHFRIEKEIKNVITVAAKTAHYWLGHIPRAQRQEIQDLVASMDAESPLVEPVQPDEAGADGAAAHASRLSSAIAHSTGLGRADRGYVNWLGVACPDVRSAVWMMRALVGCNVLSRREDTTLFVPVHPLRDPGGVRVAAAVTRVHSLAIRRGVLT